MIRIAQSVEQRTPPGVFLLSLDIVFTLSTATVIVTNEIYGACSVKAFNVGFAITRLDFI